MVDVPRWSFVPSRSRGQVTTEFVVAVLFVLLPLMILVPTLGKYLDAKHKVEVGARYAAWERTAWFPSERAGGYGAVKGEEVIQDEVQHRVLGRREAPVYTGQGDAEPVVDPLLMYAYGGDGEYVPILEPSDSDAPEHGHVIASVAGTNTPGVGGSIESVFSQISNLPVLGQFDVAAQTGSHDGAVTVSLRTPASIDEFDGLELELSRRNMLVADGWNVGGPAHNEARVRGLVPMSVLDNALVDALTSGTASVLSTVYPPASVLSDFNPGHVDVEPVPVQYLE